MKERRPSPVARVQGDESQATSPFATKQILAHHFSKAEPFKHELLNHLEPSLRLIKVSRAPSPAGLIQCTIANTSTKIAQYSCLSYAWGEPEPRRRVLINGRSLNVQPNLFGFLNAVRASIELCSHQYWIDAICIDQNNNAERNHQVAQMSDIYANARMVFVWLGYPSTSERIIPCILSSGDNSSIAPVKEAVYKDVVTNPYWTRGWITQELVFARNLVVVIGNDMIDFQMLLRPIARFWCHDLGPNEEKEGIHQFTGLPAAAQSFLGKDLISLLSSFRKRECNLIQDRIFSLVSLCKEKDDINIDYDALLHELIFQIVESCGDTCSVCMASALIDTLEIGSCNRLVQTYGHDLQPFMEFHTNGLYIPSTEEIRQTEHLRTSKWYTTDRILYPKYFPQQACRTLDRVLRHILRCIVKDSIHGSTPDWFSYSILQDEFGGSTIRIPFSAFPRSKEPCHPINKPSAHDRMPCPPIRLEYGNWNFYSTSQDAQE